MGAVFRGWERGTAHEGRGRGVKGKKRSRLEFREEKKKGGGGK